MHRMDIGCSWVQSRVGAVSLREYGCFVSNNRWPRLSYFALSTRESNDYFSCSFLAASYSAAAGGCSTRKYQKTFRPWIFGTSDANIEVTHSPYCLHALATRVSAPLLVRGRGLLPRAKNGSLVVASPSAGQHSDRINYQSEIDRPMDL